MNLGSTTERYCPTGNHFRPLRAFRVRGGKLARDCTGCEAARRVDQAKRQAAGLPPTFDGVDIDRIHYKLGAVAGRPR